GPARSPGGNWDMLSSISHAESNPLSRRWFMKVARSIRCPTARPNGERGELLSHRTRLTRASRGGDCPCPTRPGAACGLCGASCAMLRHHCAVPDTPRQEFYCDVGFCI